jgi:hypothetical protein
MELRERLRPLGAESSVFLQKCKDMIFFYSCGPSTWCRVMASPYEASRWHPLDTPHSVGLLWTSDQLVAEISVLQHTTFTTNIHAPVGIWNLDISRRATADLSLRPHGPWDRRNITIYRTIILSVVLYGCETWSLTLREECRLRVL